MIFKKLATVVFLFNFYFFSVLSASETNSSSSRFLYAVCACAIKTVVEFTENVFLTPEDIAKFYQKQCQCPAAMDLKVYQVLVKIAFKQYAVGQQMETIISAFRQDQNGISSEFGKLVQSRAIELLKEPIDRFEQQLPTLKILPKVDNSQYPALQKEIEKSKADFFKAGKLYIPECLVAADRVGERYHGKKIEKLKEFHNYFWNVYDELVRLFIKLDPQAVQLPDSPNVPLYFAIIKLCIDSGDLDYLLPSLSNDNDQSTQQKALEKITCLYFAYKLKNLLDCEVAESNKIKELAIGELTENCSDVGVLLPSIFTQVVANAYDQVRSLQKACEQERLNIDILQQADAIKIMLTPQESKARAAIAQQLKEEQQSWDFQLIESLWKAGGQQLVREQCEALCLLKQYDKMMQEHLTLQQKGIKLYERQLANIAAQEEQEKLTIQMPQQSEQLRLKNINLIRVKYFWIWQQIAQHRLKYKQDVAMLWQEAIASCKVINAEEQSAKKNIMQTMVDVLAQLLVKMNNKKNVYEFQKKEASSRTSVEQEEQQGFVQNFETYIKNGPVKSIVTHKPYSVPVLTHPVYDPYRKGDGWSWKFNTQHNPYAVEVLSDQQPYNSGGELVIHRRSGLRFERSCGLNP